MQRPRTKGGLFSLLLSSCCRVSTLLLLLTIPVLSEAEDAPGNVVCREQLSIELRAKLASDLRKITGWPSLGFNAKGELRVGDTLPSGGSQSARDLITKVTDGTDFVALEDASNRSDVAFCRVVSAQWKDGIINEPPAYVVLIDFSDFDRVMGDRRALEAFNVGWVVLHELDHVANNSEDGGALGDAGECEIHINQMRRECVLPERAEYLHTLLPISETDFRTRFVRLPFVETTSGKKLRRYWIMWDADLVGGMRTNAQVASWR